MLKEALAAAVKNAKETAATLKAETWKHVADVAATAKKNADEKWKQDWGKIADLVGKEADARKEAAGKLKDTTWQKFGEQAKQFEENLKKEAATIGQAIEKEKQTVWNKFRDVDNNKQAVDRKLKEHDEDKVNTWKKFREVDTTAVTASQAIGKLDRSVKQQATDLKETKSMTFNK